MKFILCTLVALNITSGCSDKTQPTTMDPTLPPGTKTYSYLALGDSYTIGEAVKQEESFPYQLASLLKNAGKPIADIKIIARTGWTTDELKAAIEQEKLTKKYDFVTLLIGVNNQYRHYSLDTYRKEFVELLNTAISFANGDKTKVFVVSIPDWGATPFATGQDRAKIAMEIDQFNAINKDEALKAGVSYTDITAESRKASTDAALVASDGLHPSGKMYAYWAGQLSPKITAQLK